MGETLALVVGILIAAACAVYLGAFLIAWIADIYNHLRGRPTHHSEGFGSDYDPNATDPSDGGY